MAIIKLVILFSILFSSSVACAFAITPQISCKNNLRSSSRMASDRCRRQSNFGTFIGQSLHHKEHNSNECGSELLPPLTMIPDSRNQYDQDRNSTRSSYPLTFLDATKRSRGKSKELHDESDATRLIQSITKPLKLFSSALSSSKTLQGRMILLFVAFLYGTLNVVLRGIYASDGPPAASVLSFVRQILSVIAFIPLLAYSKEDDTNSSDLDHMSNANTEVEKVARPMWMAALELAFWNFGAQGLINAGLLSSPAARASFLTQTSVVMTPLISRLAGERIKNTVWGGCVLALGGLFLISTASVDGSDAANAVDDAGMSISFSDGDAMILLGALSWSTYIFRTSKIANAYPELSLQSTKNGLLALMYGTWFTSNAISALASAGTTMFSTGWTEALKPLWSGWNSPLVWLLLIYSVSLHLFQSYALHIIYN